MSNLQSFFVVVLTLAAIFVPQFAVIYFGETPVGEAA